MFIIFIYKIKNTLNNLYFVFSFIYKILFFNEKYINYKNLYKILKIKK